MGAKKVISPAIILAIVAVVIVAVIVYASNKSTNEVALNDKTAPIATGSEVAVIQEDEDEYEDDALETDDEGVVATTTTSGGGSAAVTQTNATFADGTYTAVGDYTAPSGAEHINVTLTLKDNVVVDSTVTAATTQAISLKLQNDFIANYKTMVVGKKISDIKLGKVSGSSLTPIGFNNAVDKIEAEAKV